MTTGASAIAGGGWRATATPIAAVAALLSSASLPLDGATHQLSFAASVWLR